MDPISREKKVLEELVKAREAVKRKFNLIKSEKDNTERILNETFKPITDPLQKLVKENKPTVDDNFQIKKQNESIKQEAEDSFIDNLRNISDPYASIRDESTIYDEAQETVIENEETDIFTGLSDLDKVYGIRFEEDGFKLGSASIKFFKNYILVNDTKYLRTQGLFNLIVLKNPEPFESKDLITL